MPRKVQEPRIPIDELSGCTCLRLRKLTRRVTQIYDRRLQKAGLSGPQFSLLATLNRKPGRSVGELGEALLTDPTTLTRILRPLEERGLLAIVPDADDRRRRAVVLTPAGRAAIVAALPEWRKAQARVVELLGAEHVATLHDAVDRALPRLVC